jgi:hypothetical protein
LTLWWSDFNSIAGLTQTTAKKINSPDRIIEDALQGGYYVFDGTTGRGFAVSREGLFNGFREQ